MFTRPGHCFLENHLAKKEGTLRSVLELFWAAGRQRGAPAYSLAGYETGITR